MTQRFHGASFGVENGGLFEAVDRWATGVEPASDEGTI
jgi:hypothetical protein